MEEKVEEGENEEEGNEKQEEGEEDQSNACDQYSEHSPTHSSQLARQPLQTTMTNNT